MRVQQFLVLTLEAGVLVVVIMLLGISLPNGNHDVQSDDPVYLTEWRPCFLAPVSAAEMTTTPSAPTSNYQMLLPYLARQAQRRCGRYLNQYISPNMGPGPGVLFGIAGASPS